MINIFVVFAGTFFILLCLNHTPKDSMQYRLLVIAACLTGLIATAARADDGPCCRAFVPRWYAGISGAVTFVTNGDLNFAISGLGSETVPITYSPGFGVGGEVGYRIYPNIRGELEVIYRQNELDTVDGIKYTPPSGTVSPLRSTALMANLYYDYHNTTSFTPYLGGGAGPIHIKPPYYLAGSSMSAWALGYQFMTGITYEIKTAFNPFEINLGYRYVGGHSPQIALPQIGGTAKYSIKYNNIELGAKMFF